MFNGLKKLFGKKPETQDIPSAESSGNPGRPVRDTPFLRREAVFDRSNRLSGHLFRLQQSTVPASVDDGKQRDFDQTLLDTLNASPEAWNTSLAFIPLSSSSLDLPALDRLKKTNIVLLIQLAADAEADMVCEAIDQLRQRGLLIGVFRQPKHRAFARVIQQVDYAAIDVAGSEANAVRDFSAANRSGDREHPVRLFA